MTHSVPTGKLSHTMLNPSKMPIKWVAIEGLRKPEFSEATDMWSFGVMCWEVLTLGASPYIGVTIKEMYVRLLEGMRLEQPPSCPTDVSVFLVCLISFCTVRWNLVFILRLPTSFQVTMVLLAEMHILVSKLKGILRVVQPTHLSDSSWLHQLLMSPFVGAIGGTSFSPRGCMTLRTAFRSLY
jgi:serine/threonine protein kinase